MHTVAFLSGGEGYQARYLARLSYVSEQPIHTSKYQEANSHRNDRLRCIRQVEVITVIMFKNGFSPFRWRRLPGKIPGKDELRAKMSQLHERLDKEADSHRKHGLQYI